jgi:hypothetical protein
MVLAVRYEDVVTAFRAEAERLAGAMLASGKEAFDRPTACEPWTVADLLAHVRTAIGRLWGMPEEPEPEPAACVSAVGYYRSDARFSPETNAARIAAAQQDATAMRWPPTLTGPGGANTSASLWHHPDGSCGFGMAT